MKRWAEFRDDFGFDHDDDEEGSFGCEHEACDADVIAGWFEHEDTRLGVLGCPSGHLEIYEHREREGRDLCWNCWQHPGSRAWGRAEGLVADGGYCSRSCRDQDTPQRIVRLAFKLFNASGDRRLDALRQIVDEASLLGSPKAR